VRSRHTPPISSVEGTVLSAPKKYIRFPLIIISPFVLAAGRAPPWTKLPPFLSKPGNHDGRGKDLAGFLVERDTCPRTEVWVFVLVLRIQASFFGERRWVFS
jgi:hypothetical protein